LGPTRDESIERLGRGESVGAPTARWTSYGLNSFTTQFARPQVIDPRTGNFAGPWERLGQIPRPSATVHFVMMTEGTTPASRAYGMADHVHPEQWDAGGQAGAPVLAGNQMHVASRGGPGYRGSGRLGGRSLSAYGFLDGHAAVLPFERVYRTGEDNAFWPEMAR
jgi:hypothetical protein